MKVVNYDSVVACGRYVVCVNGTRYKYCHCIVFVSSLCSYRTANNYLCFLLHSNCCKNFYIDVCILLPLLAVFSVHSSDLFSLEMHLNCMHLYMPRLNFHESNSKMTRNE